MGIHSLFDGIVQYISEAVTRIFGPNDDSYPVIGFQPFAGEPFKDKQKVNW